MSTGCNLPFGFLQAIAPLLGEAVADFVASCGQPPQRALLPSPRRALDTSPWCGEDPVPWAEAACYLRPDARPGAHPLHWAGAYYLQEPSAMAAVAALNPQPGDRVLDLCAAPGGKSVQIAQALNAKGLLVSNDPVYSRALALSGNIERMGIRNALVLCNQPEELTARFEAYFDQALVDAPCSGEGMFRKDPAVAAQWQPDLPDRLAPIQLHILRQAASMLRPGGTLVYSTCTFNTTENEGVLQDFLDQQPEFSLQPFDLPGLPEAQMGSLRLWPHLQRGEGHFVAKLRKDGGAGSRQTGLFNMKTDQALVDLANVMLPDWVNDPPRANASLGETTACLPLGCPDVSGLRVLRLGLHLAQRQGKTLRPAHALALSAAPRQPVVVDVNQAHSFRAGEVLAVDTGLEGYAAPALMGWSLGWGKAVKGHLKNHYPKGLRRHQAMQDKG